MPSGEPLFGVISSLSPCSSGGSCGLGRQSELSELRDSEARNQSQTCDIVVPSSNTCPVLPGIVGVFQAAVSETLVIM